MKSSRIPFVRFADKELFVSRLFTLRSNKVVVANLKEFYNSCNAGRFLPKLYEPQLRQ